MSQNFDELVVAGIDFLSHMSTHDDYLAHYGIKGQKKGQRRYQNEDGSLTLEGYRHYGIDPNGRSSIAKVNNDKIRLTIDPSHLTRPKGTGPVKYPNIDRDPNKPGTSWFDKYGHATRDNKYYNEDGKMEKYNKMFTKTDEVLKNYDPKTVKKRQMGLSGNNII